MERFTPPVIIRPQPGPQEKFLSSTADITGYGGAAGGGKTWSILAEPLRHVDNPDFGAVIFRRSMPEIMNEGGLWDEAGRMYSQLNAYPRIQSHSWIFSSGMSVRFAHLQYDDTVYDWQGSQIGLIEFDELTHFSQFQFFYMMSRLRSMAGVRAYIRCTFNPDASSWVKVFFGQWVDKKHPDPAEDGEIRYFIRLAGLISWFKDPEEALFNLQKLDPEAHPDDVKSVTFIKSRVTDNPAMLERNPGYVGWLKSLPPLERARLLDGDWDVLPSGGKIFDRANVKVVQRLPDLTDPVYNGWGEVIEPGTSHSTVRRWDLAATEKKLKGKQPDWTAGVRMTKIGTQFFITDVIRVQLGPADVDELIKDTAREDTRAVRVRWEQEGGASGKRDSYNLVSKLAGYDAEGVPSIGDKVQRAKAFASQVRVGNVSIVAGPYVDDYLTELHHFPDWVNDDQVDASSGAFTDLIDEATDVVVTESPLDYE